MTTTSPSNAALIRRTFDALNRGDVSALRQFWTDDTVERFPDRTCRGADELAAYFQEALAAIPDWHMEMLAIAEEGEHVFVQWRLTGTHSGRIQDIAPTGKHISIDGMDHFVVREDKIVSNFVVFDQMQYARQLGMMPPEGSVGDRAVKTIFNAKTKLVRRSRG